ncbi:MAG: VWA domain-containing protein [Alphaproteobacteria bacterium]|nr:VWA domain-containing protein [Alphaproteobacteria bacterium]
MSNFSGFEFIWPLAFLLLPLPFIIRHLLKPVRISSGGALRVPFYRRITERAGSGQYQSGYRIWRIILASLIWILLVTASARPVFIGPEISLPIEGRDLMMAIDLSGSMGREDFDLNGQASNRLAVVKTVADDFIARRKGDRLGLVLFSDRAYLQVPLTFDHNVVRTLLAEAQVGLTGQKTAIGDAIAIAAKRLKDRPVKSRVLVLLTDGANNSGVMQPLQAARLAKKLDIRIYTIGVGANRMVVQTAFGRQIVNPSEDLDEKTLGKIAKLTGGRYFRATDVKSLAGIYAELDQLEPVSGDPQFIRPSVSLYSWPLGMALALVGVFGLILIVPSIITLFQSKNLKEAIS